MSKTVDSRVVEMRFDNSNFEANVRTSMSTLERLKQSLNLTKSAKGLEGLSAAAKKVDFSGMENGIDAVQAKFSALQVMGVTALANITNSAVNAGKKIISALTFEPVMTGFHEYETQINAVQTILANTQKEGTNVQIVNKALDELNTYADKTIYNFTEMTRNIGTFTAAGVKLQTSVDAIQGIANLAAMSGSTSQQASTAMYQLSQALAAGTVKLMDWNSVVNAGMGGAIFQDALRETSELLGTGAEAAIKANGSFRESLHTGWLTSEVLTETLKKFTTSGAIEHVAEYTGLSEKAVQAALDSAEAQYGEADAIDKAAEALAKKSGKSKDEIKSALELAKSAEDAATKVKTFSQLWDTMKEAVQSGWAQTWRLIIGDFEEAGELLTGISDFFNGIITNMSNARNDLLQSALGKSFSGMAKKMNDLLEPAKKAADTVKDVGDSIADLGDIVDDVILGKFGNGQERFEALTKAGQNWMEVQNKVNEKLGDSHRYTKEQIAAQDKLISKQKESTKETAKTGEETKKLTDEQKKRIVQLAKMSDEELRLLGYNEKQIKAFQELRDTAEQLGLPLDTFIMKMDEINGRWLLWNSFANVGKAIGKVFGSIGEAWGDVFDPIKPEQIFNAIAAFHKFTSSLIMNKDTAEDLRNTFRGLFTILDIVTTVLGGGIKIGFKVLNAILRAFGTNILKVTGTIGNAIYSIKKFVFETNPLAKAIKGFINDLPKAAKQLKAWFDAFKGTPAVQKFLDIIETFKSTLSELFTGRKFPIEDYAHDLGMLLANALKSLPKIAVQIGKDVIAGFQNGIEVSISGSVIGKIISFCKSFIDAFAEALGVHSPSWKTYNIAVDTIQGFINGLKAVVGGLFGLIINIGEKIISLFEGFWDFIVDDSGKVQWDKVFAGGVTLSLVWFTKQIADAISGIADAFGGLGDILDNAGLVLKSFSKVLKGISWDFKAKAIQKLAISIAILVGAIVVLTMLDPKEAWNAVGIVTVLAGVLVALAVAMDKMEGASISLNKKGKGLKLEGLKSGLISIGASLLMLAVTVKLIGSLKPGEAIQGFIGLAGLIAAVAIVFAAYGTLIQGKAAKNIDKAGIMVRKLATSLLLLAITCKIIGMLSAEDMIQGGVFMAAFLVFVTLLVKATGGGKYKNIDKLGKMVRKMATAMLIMVLVCKLVGMLSAEEMLQGGVFALAFVAFVRFLVKATEIGKDSQIAKLGGLLMAISVAMLLMVGVCKLVGLLSAEDMLKGAAFMAAYMLMIKSFVKILAIGNEQQMMKTAGTILALSIAIGIMAAVSIALSLVDIGGLAKGITAVGLLSVMMTVMIKSLKGAQNVKGAIAMMAASIAVMAAAVVALSFIDTSKLAGATVALSVLMGMFSLMAKMSNGVKVDIKSMAGMLAVIGVLSAILYVLSSLEFGSVLEVSASLSLLMTSLALSMKIMSTTGSTAMSAMPAMYAMSGVLAIVATILGILASLNVGSTLEIAASLALLLTSLSTSMILVSAVGPTAMTAMPAMLAMSGVLAIVATIVGILAALNLGSTVEIANSLSQLLLALSSACLIMAGSAAIATVAAAGLAPMMTLMIGMGALMAVIAGLVTFIPGLESFLTKALPILKLLGQGIGEFLGGIISGIANSVMDILPRFGTSLSMFMVGLQPFIAMAGNIDSNVLTGIAYLSAAIVALTAANIISGIGQFLSFGQSFSDLGTQLSDFMTNASPFLSAIQTLDPKSVEAANTLAKMILTLTAASFLDSIKDFISFFTGGNSFADFGDELAEFGTAIVKFSDSIDGKINEEAVQAAANAGTAMSKLAKSLPKKDGFLQDVVGEQDLADFGELCVAFGASMKKMSNSLTGEGGAILVNEEAINSAAKAGQGMAKLAKAIPKKDGFLQDVIGEQDLANFGTTCEAFGKAMRKMSQSLTGENGASLINEEAINSAVKAGQGMTKVAKAIPKSEGFLQDIVGQQDLEKFGTTCEAFGKSIKKMSSSLSGEDGENAVNEEAINSAVKAGQGMTRLAKALPEEGFLDGKVNLSEFSSYIKDFGAAIADFSKKVVDIDGEKINVAITAANKIKFLINSLEGLNTENLSKFTGIGVGGFGANGGAISDVAKAISDFADKVGSIDVEKVTVAVSSANKLKNLINSLVSLDTSGIEKFKVGAIGTQMKTYAEKVKDMDAGNVSSSISSANRLKTFIAGLSGLDPSGVSNFKVGTIGSAMRAYSSAMADFNSGAVSSSISAATKLKNFISSLAGLDTGGVSSFVSAINKLGKVSVNDIVKSFSGASGKMLSSGAKLIESVAKGIKSKQGSINSAITSVMSSSVKAITSKASSFQNAGSQLMMKLTSGIRSKAKTASDTVKSAVSSAATSIRNKHSSFYSAGQYLGEGLVDGIESKEDAAYEAGYALGQAAVRGEKDGQASNSPSKLTIQAGKWLGEGLVIGINRMGSKVYRAGHDLGDSAAHSMSNSISKIADAINTDIDAQPTIRPVLDLDNIKSGAGIIDGLLNRGGSVGVTANINAISSMMRNRNQNGVNDDVVSAINKLRKDLGNVGNTTYNVNGVTYDDGSNITQAVETLVRAAIVERRI